MKKNIVKIEKELCKSCGLCIVECKQNIIEISQDINKMGYRPVFIKDQSLCTGCTMCAVACPECAIEIYQKEE